MNLGNGVMEVQWECSCGGPPYSAEKLTGKSCYYLQSGTQSEPIANMDRHWDENPKVLVF